MKRERAHPVVVFDAKCVLCSRGAQLLLKVDREKVFRFASMQSDVGRKLLAESGLKIDDPESFLVITDGKAFRDTAATLRIAHELGWPWRLAWVFWVVPAPLRDAVYRWVARNRYRWFGKRETCYVPGEEDKARFLD